MPPTKIGQFGYRRYDYQGRSSRAGGAALTPSVIWLNGSWAGYEPSLNPTETSPGASSDCAGLIDRDGTLSQQNGFEQVASATLPLGDASPPADAVDAEPVVCIAEGRDSTSQETKRYAITSDSAANGRGHFYELVSAVWTHRAFGGAGNAFTGDSSDPASTLCDSAHFQAGNYTVFASGQANSLYRYPGAAVPTEYEVLGNLGSLTSLTANSVLSSEERIHAFGTTEGGTFYPTRWRWTSRGANGRFDPTLTGAGFVELGELGGEALAVRNIGPKIALYTTQGVAFAKRTSIHTDPFAKDYVAYDRGLLSTQSVVNIGSGVHFGLFTDGWYTLTYDGQWEERGLNGKRYHKWFREFYGNLDWNNRKRVVCAYDKNNQWIYIGFPVAGESGDGPNLIWVYDLLNDRCWPTAGWSKKPNIFGEIAEESTTGATWGSFTTTWGSSVGSWGSYETSVGQTRVLHGTNDGYVFVHHPALVTQDNVLPTYRYKTHYFGGQTPELHRTIDGIHLRYTSLNGDVASPSPISISYENENGTIQNGTVQQTKGSGNTQQMDFASPGAVSGQQHRFTISGSSPVKIGGIGVSITSQAGKTRKEDSV